MNAVCPLVTKVHHEAKVRANKGFTVLYVGHEGHDEATGTLAVAPEAMRLVEREEDLDAVLSTVPDPSQVALLAQTTLSVNDWQGIMTRAREHFPDLWTATRNDLCFATTNRQAALRAIAERADTMVVIGSANSSNTIALTKVARAAGCERVLRVDGPDEIDDETLGERAHRRRHRGCQRAGGSGAGGDRASRSRRRRRDRARHRRRRVLPSPARAPGARPPPRRRTELHQR